MNRYGKANGLGCFLPFHRPCPDHSGQAMCGILFFSLPGLAGARLNATVKGIGAGAKSLPRTTTITWAAAAAAGRWAGKLAGGSKFGNFCQGPRIKQASELKIFLE